MGVATALFAPLTNVAWRCEQTDTKKEKRIQGVSEGDTT